MIITSTCPWLTLLSGLARALDLLPLRQIPYLSFRHWTIYGDMFFSRFLMYFLVVDELPEVVPPFLQVVQIYLFGGVSYFPY